MISRFRLAAVLAAITAMLAIASPAMAKGGSGSGSGGVGGGGRADVPCATFSSYGFSQGATATGASFTINYSVAYSCIDEVWPPLRLVVTNVDTGQSFTSITAGPILPGIHTITSALANATKYTVSLFLDSGTSTAIYDSRTQTFTTPPAPQP
jgi:hypothetical protein